MSENAPNRVLLRAQDLVKVYPARGIGRTRTREVRAVDGVSFDLKVGETLAIVGESGSGKSTVANAVLRLHDVTSGSIEFDGKDITKLSRGQMHAIRRDLQVVFQDPYESLDPRMRLGDIVAEPLRIHSPDMKRSERQEIVREMMSLVGLGSMPLDRYPHQLSGGQRQRVGIARALIIEPKLVVCDEAVSALDVSVQAQVLDLLSDLKERLGLSYLFITHDLAVVRQVADRVLVLYHGQVVEEGMTDEVLDHPREEYTRNLIAAVPGQRAERERMKKETV